MPRCAHLPGPPPALLPERWQASVDLRPLDRPHPTDPTRGHIVLSPDDAAWARHKDRTLRTDRARCCPPAHTGDAVLRALADTLIGVLTTEHPDTFTLHDDTLEDARSGLAVDRTTGDVRVTGRSPAPGWDEVREGWARLERPAPGPARVADAIARLVPEDLVLMTVAPDRECAAWLHVCAPSGWCPASKAGHGFDTIHRPVPHSDRLRSLGPGLMHAACVRGPFVRWTWGLHPHDALDHHPTRQAAHPAAPLPLDDPEAWARAWHLRWERQTLCPVLTAEAALFTIRVFQAPLAHTGLSAAQAKRLHDTLASMDRDVLAYKGLTHARGPLMAWLAARSRDSALPPRGPALSPDGGG
jgi:hypothetical protein